MPLPPSRSRADRRDPARGAGVVVLRERRLGRAQAAGQLEVGEVPAVQLHRGQLVEHLREALLHHLELRERLAELHALLRVR